VRALAAQAFSRAAGAPLVPGNSIRVLRDARENYPAWLDAIARGTRFIHFESYIIHDDTVGAEFLEDLTNATEVTLNGRPTVRRAARSSDRPAARGGGSAGRAAAGLLRISNTIGAAVTDHRVLEPVEARITFVVGCVLLAVGVLAALFPRVLAYPIEAVTVWLAARSHTLHQRGRRERN
jgi:cardiolipin synthase